MLSKTTKRPWLETTRCSANYFVDEFELPEFNNEFELSRKLFKVTLWILDPSKATEPSNRPCCIGISIMHKEGKERDRNNLEVMGVTLLSCADYGERLQFGKGPDDNPLWIGKPRRERTIPQSATFKFQELNIMEVIKNCGARGYDEHLGHSRFIKSMKMASDKWHEWRYELGFDVRQVVTHTVEDA